MVTISLCMIVKNEEDTLAPVHGLGGLKDAAGVGGGEHAAGHGGVGQIFSHKIAEHGLMAAAAAHDHDSVGAPRLYSEGLHDGMRTGFRCKEENFVSGLKNRLPVDIIQPVLLTINGNDLNLDPRQFVLKCTNRTSAHF